MDCGLTTVFFWLLVALSLYQSVQAIRLRLLIRKLEWYEQYYRSQHHYQGWHSRDW